MSETTTHIPIEAWGRDHWSTLAYIETRITDHGGRLLIPHMRCDPALHPHFSHEGNRAGFGGDSKPCPTRLRDREISGHDDWSCADDAEAAGLLRNTGTGMHRRYELTARGRTIANALRDHLGRDGSMATFTPPAVGA